MKSVSIVGVGLSPEDLTLQHSELIKTADILVGGKRQLGFFPQIDCVKWEINKNLKELATRIYANEEKKIVVLASGDPLFYGIGTYLTEFLGKENVHIYPNISSVAMAFARIKIPWHDVRVVSMHGRNMDDVLVSALQSERQIAILTDPKRNPTWIAKKISDLKTEHFQMCIIEKLGSAEHIEWMEPQQAESRSFTDPNLVILIKQRDGIKKANGNHPEATNDGYVYENDLITKPEVRAISISKLRLLKNHVMWDLGAGSGSISIEASRYISTGRIISVEKNKDRIVGMKKNIAQFNATGIDVLQLILPAGLEALLPPDRVFIGGGGRALEDIIQSAAKFLKPGGILVVNTVLIQSTAVALNLLKSLGFKTEAVQIQASRIQPMPWGDRFKGENPVCIISGEKPL